MHWPARAPDVTSCMWDSCWSPNYGCMGLSAGCGRGLRVLRGRPWTACLNACSMQLEGCLLAGVHENA